jgi:hypothetical protein
MNYSTSNSDTTWESGERKGASTMLSSENLMFFSAGEELRIAAEIAECVSRADPHDMVNLFHNLRGGSVSNWATLRISRNAPDDDSLTRTGWAPAGEWRIPICPKTPELAKVALPSGRLLGEMIVSNGLITGELAARNFPLVAILDPSLVVRRVQEAYSTQRRLGAIATAITFTASGMRRLQAELYPRLSALDLSVPMPGEHEGLSALERVIKCFAVWGRESKQEELPSCFLASLLLGWLSAGHGAEVGKVLGRGSGETSAEKFWEGIVSQASAERRTSEKLRGQPDDDSRVEQEQRLVRMACLIQDVCRESPQALTVLEELIGKGNGTKNALNWAVEKSGIAPDIATLLGRTRAAAALAVQEGPDDFRGPIL